MKKLLFTLSILTSFITFGQYQYNVSVDLSDASKEVFNELDYHINTKDRKIEGNVISFQTSVNYSETYIDSLFVLIGADPFLVIKEKIILSLPPEKAGGNNCELAEILCSNSSLPGNSAGLGTQELNSTNQGCLGVEHQSSWYYLNVQTGGTLSFVINPNNNTNDYDFAVWGSFTATTANANCPPITQPIRCSFAEVFGNGNTGLINDITPCDAFETINCGGCFPNTDCVYGDQFVNQLTVTPGQIYILMIDNWSVTNQGYDLSFGGTATLGCTPVVLPIELYSFSGSFYGNNNTLYWTTSSEYNNDYFTLERSINGVDWEIISTQPSLGNSTTDQYYSYIDWEYVEDSINYYQLSQTDNNGELRVFDVISIDNRLKNNEGELIRTVNILGQEVNSGTGLLFDVYSNGKVKRKIVE